MSFTSNASVAMKNFGLVLGSMLWTVNSSAQDLSCEQNQCLNECDGYEIQSITDSSVSDFLKDK